MIVCRHRRLFVLMLALIWALGMGFSNVQSGQIAAMQAAGMRMNLPADCLFCGDEDGKMNVVACIYICINPGAAVSPVLDTAIDLQEPPIAGPSKTLASNRARRPDPYPPKINS